MYKVKYWFLTPSAVRSGVAISPSPKEAFRKAISEADSKFVGCESIGAEGYTMWLNDKVVYNYCDLD
jgi:hypothetical protein